MAVNLRLSDESAAALRAESARTGLSQQEILRRAVDVRLHIDAKDPIAVLPDWVEPPAMPYRPPTVRLPATRDSIIDTLVALREDRM